MISWHGGAVTGDWFDRQRQVMAAIGDAPSRAVWAQAFIRREVHGGPLSLPGLTSQSMAARQAPLHVALWPADAPGGTVPVVVLQAEPSARAVLRPGEAVKAVWFGELIPGAAGALAVNGRLVAPTMAPGPALPGDPVR